MVYKTLFLYLQSVIVKSIERNASNMYEARRRLLGLLDEPMPVVTSSGYDLPITTTTANSLGLAGLGEYRPHEGPIASL